MGINVNDKSMQGLRRVPIPPLKMSELIIIPLVLNKFPLCFRKLRGRRNYGRNFDHFLTFLETESSSE